MRIPRLAGLLRWLIVIVAVLAMALLVMWMSGVFAKKLPSTGQPTVVGRPLPAGTATVLVVATTVPVREEAVGAVRAIQEIQVAARILARIRTMHITAAGHVVKRGDLLVEFEDEDLKARLSEAEAAHRSAEETRAQAERELAREQALAAQEIASERAVENARTALATAVANVERAAQNAKAAATMMSFAQLRAPIDGVVIDKRKQAGDTAAPGEVLATLFDPTRMQLVASVREELAQALKIGGEVAVRIDSLGLDCRGTVSEIVPQAAAGSRSFDVKVTGPCPPGLFSGMFGRLFVDLGTRSVLRVPQSAVRAIGQVDQVVVVDAGMSLRRRFVVLGERQGDQVEVVSGLAAGETIVADASALRGEAGR